MSVTAFALSLVLLAPPTLGDALRAIGAVPGPAVVEVDLSPAPAPPRTAARWTIAAGAALIASGLLGMLLSPECATRDASGRCVDPKGSAAVFPAMVVLGFGATVTGAWWYRRDSGLD
ncbi:MAG: hypothetical protein KC620_04055 [Myxococcales bacterium]|nr:hypothetical protein [Myxococcales bacterium]